MTKFRRAVEGDVVGGATVVADERTSATGRYGWVRMRCACGRVFKVRAWRFNRAKVTHHVDPEKKRRYAKGRTVCYRLGCEGCVPTPEDERYSYPAHYHRERGREGRGRFVTQVPRTPKSRGVVEMLLKDPESTDFRAACEKYGVTDQSVEKMYLRWVIYPAYLRLRKEVEILRETLRTHQCP